MLLGSAAVVTEAAIASSLSAQFIAWHVGYHPALGVPWSSQFYAPCEWIEWRASAWAPNAEATFQVVDAGLPMPGSRLDHDVLVVPLLVSREICLARSKPMPQGSPTGHQGAPERWFTVGRRVVQ